jgi:ATP-dependent Clp protease protease subunit
MTLLPPQYYTIEDSNVILVNGPIDNDMADYFTRMMLEKNFKDPDKRPDHIKVFINSPGGIVSDCFCMIDIMNAFPIPIYTYGIGMIASCGLMLFLSGNKGNRYIFKNTSILSHQWSGAQEGKEHEIIAAARENKMISKRIYTIYENATGLSKDDIHKHLLPPEDRWLSPTECVKYGLADKVISKI